MGKLLDEINGREDLVKLNTEQLYSLAGEIREYIIDVTAENGGHLASNLGAVELTIALYRALRPPKDKIIWDVGHQSYTHKIFSGRKESLKSLRRFGGECGFCDPSESEFDTYTSGHTSTSLSLALGAACARDLNGERYNVAAIIGDGALTGGLAREALDNIGHLKKRMLIVLNDNEMSISKNVGAMSNYLMHARTSSQYARSKTGIERTLERIPNGKNIADFVRRTKEHVKYLVSPGVIFEELGITYLGPIDGHDIRLMEDTFRRALRMDEPVLVHIVTKKGKGYSFAENEPQKYHGVAPFNKEKKIEDSCRETYSSVFGDEMCRMAENGENIAVITPAMTLGSGLKEFAQKYPERFYDVGIAEAHAVTFAAGLSAGVVPVVSLYSSFAQRAYDSFVHDAAVGKRHIVFAIDRAGLVPGDGKTHQGTLDIAFLSSIPNVSVFSPCSFEELRKMLRCAVQKSDNPVVVRYPKGCAQYEGDLGEFEPGKAAVIKKGRDVTIVAEGAALPEAVKAEKILYEKGIDAEVINVRSIKPLDMGTVSESVKKTGKLVTIEQGVRRGGMGEEIAARLAEEKMNFEVVVLALDEFVPHGTYEEILKAYKLDAQSVADAIKKEWFYGENEA
ncbi:MAG: 1-deoxy-D-xylulose-5-phosphate synthase [Clostridia bacterium]|nr:1-deoxy-D-xylulose-5-phosphate synthase [Clostridia bacterium]